MGNLPSLHATSLLLEELSPYYVILSGICGGIINPKMKLGDVVLSNRVIYYEPGKVAPGEDERREKRFFEDASNQKESALMVAGKGIIGKGWDAIDNIRVPWPAKGRGRHRPIVFEGVVCSGEKVIADSKYAEELRKLHPDAISIEMEAAGIAYACQNTGTEFLVIKGVSDFADENKSKSEEPKRNYRNYAKASAAAFVTFLLKDGNIILPPRKAPKLALSDFLLIKRNEQVMVVLPGYPNPRHQGSQMSNYPYNEYETAYDDVYCAFRILPALESACGNRNIRYVSARAGGFNIYEPQNLILIGSSCSNAFTRDVLEGNRAYFLYGEGESDHDIVDQEGKILYSAQTASRTGDEEEYIKDYSLISVFSSRNKSVVILAGCRAYGQLLLGDFLAEGDIIEEVFRHTILYRDFQCVLSVKVVGRHYRLDRIEELVVRKDIGANWDELPLAVKSINKIIPGVRNKLISY